MLHSWSHITNSYVNLSWVYKGNKKVVYTYNNTIVQNCEGIEARLHQLHLVNEAVGSPKVKRLSDIKCFNHVQFWVYITPKHGPHLLHVVEGALFHLN